MRQRISMKKTTEMTLKEAYELFERKGRVRNLSENTLNTYKYHFDALCRCIDENRNCDKTSLKPSLNTVLS